MSEHVMWYVYIIECKNGALYTGVTTDIARRFQEHTGGKGAKYTRANTPKKLVYTETCNSKSDAHKREAEIKKWRRDKKLTLIKA